MSRLVTAILDTHLLCLWQGFRHDAHPMAMMVGVVGSLAAFCECPHTLAVSRMPSSAGANKLTSCELDRLIAKLKAPLA